MHPFILERPRDLAAALTLRAQAGRNDAPAEYIAGGTDMVRKRSGCENRNHAAA
jgi:xanthine dehydrogenase YagS FAD-binding subunit